MMTRTLLLFAVLTLAIPGAAQQPKTLDHLTAYFIYSKLSGEPINLEAIADQTQRVGQARGFGRVAVRALEVSQLKAKFEAADPEAPYVISFQTLMTYELNQARFSVQTFEPGRVLVLNPFGPGSAHPMPASFAGQFAARLFFANADEARYVPLAPDQARVIDPVARSGGTGAVADVTLHFLDVDPAQRVLRAQVESVSYRYAAAPGLVRMTNPRLWPLNEPVAVAAATAAETGTPAGGTGAITVPAASSPAIAASPAASPPTMPSAPAAAATETALPMDALTLLFAYHKLSGEPIDFEAIARNMAVVHRASPFDREKVAAEKATELRTLYEAVDTSATHAVALRTSMRYEMNQERFDVDTFGAGRFMTYPSPFMPVAMRRDAPARGNHGFMDQTLAYRYGRRLSFTNAANARYVPMPQSDARILLGAGGNVTAEVHFKLADTVDNVEEQFKTVRAQITSVSYTPGIGRAAANWPLKDPIQVAATDLSASVASAEMGNRLDHWTVYFLYAKVAGEPVDFAGIAERSDNYRRAPQFDKASVRAREMARLQEQYDAIDPTGTFSLRVGGMLQYEMDQERFRVELFDPGKFVNFNPMQSGTPEFARSARRLAFANAEALRYIAVPRDRAGQIGQVRQLGNTGASAALELTVAGIGDPTGAVNSDGTLRMAVRSVRFHPSGARPEDVWPLDDPIRPAAWSAHMDPPVIAPGKFDTMGLNIGVRLDALKRQVEQEFGAVVNINPSRSEDPRLKTGVGFSPDSCFAFGNKVPSPGAICIRAYADDGGIVRKIIVEQILEGADWESMRVALLGKYGAMAVAERKSQTQYYGWGPQVVPSIAADDSLSPNRALTASLSPIQSDIDRMSASTRVSTNLRIRLIDPKWAGAPVQPVVGQQKEQPAPARTPRL